MTAEKHMESDAMRIVRSTNASDHIGNWEKKFDKEAPPECFESGVQDGVRFVEYSIPAHRATRGEALIDNDSTAYLFISYCRSGGVYWDKGKKQPILHSEGTFGLWRSDLPLVTYGNSLAHNFLMVLAIDPASTICRDTAGSLGQVLHGEAGLNSVLMDMLKTVQRNWRALEPGQAATVTKTIVDLFSSVGASQQCHSNSGKNQLLRMSLRFVEDNLMDPNLNPQLVANAVGVSLRYLHHLFADHGETVSKYIWSRRLYHCKQELASVPASTISEVAYRWGFKDTAHFSRAFKLAFGASPRQFRQEIGR